MFDEMPEKDVVAWIAIISGHVQNGESERGLEYLCKMHSVGSDDEKPIPRTLECGFQAFANLSVLKEGRCLHGFAVKNGFSFFQNCPVFEFFIVSKYENLAEAYLSLRDLGGEDMFSWTSIIASLARSGYMEQSFDMLFEMQKKGIQLDGVVISCLIDELGKMMLVGLYNTAEGYRYSRQVWKWICKEKKPG